MRQDRFLFALLIAVGALALISLGLFFVQQNAQTYGPDEAPSDVVRNYLLAVQEEDYERAYQYLLEEPQKPAFEEFHRSLLQNSDAFFQVAVQIGESEVIGQEALVDLVLVDYGSGPLGDVFREATQASLERDSSGGWKILFMPYPYWGFDWYLDSTPG